MMDEIFGCAPVSDSYFGFVTEDGYDDFLFLSEDAKEKISKMSDGELDTLSRLLAHSITETRLKIMDEMNGRK
jgi:hypothetical protein